MWSGPGNSAASPDPRHHEQRRKFIGFLAQPFSGSELAKIESPQEFKPEQGFIALLDYQPELRHEFAATPGSSSRPIVCGYRSTRSSQLVGDVEGLLSPGECTCEPDDGQGKFHRAIEYALTLLRYHGQR